MCIRDSSSGAARSLGSGAGSACVVPKRRSDSLTRTPVCVRVRVCAAVRPEKARGAEDMYAPGPPSPPLPSPPLPHAGAHASVCVCVCVCGRGELHPDERHSVHGARARGHRVLR
eukprot:3842426-Rhodomonas_salina.1